MELTRVLPEPVAQRIIKAGFELANSERAAESAWNLYGKTLQDDMYGDPETTKKAARAASKDASDKMAEFATAVYQVTIV
jgi:hypothetical protein